MDVLAKRSFSERQDIVLNHLGRGGRQVTKGVHLDWQHQSQQQQDRARAPANLEEEVNLTEDGDPEVAQKAGTWQPLTPLDITGGPASSGPWTRCAGRHHT
jgi:hypothetical protein